MTDLRNIKCSRCNTYRYEKQFIAKDRVMKTCEVCRENGKKYADKNRDKKKQYRIENRNKISENKKQWHIDNPQYSKQYEEEQKKNNQLQWKFRYMINHSKVYDKKHKLTITEDYITLDYLNQLWIFQKGRCFYQDCDCILDYESFDKHKRNDNLITIQRHDNNICHSESNTCLACWNCNVIKRKERQQFTQLLEATEQMTLE